MSSNPTRGYDVLNKPEAGDGKARSWRNLEQTLRKYEPIVEKVVCVIFSVVATESLRVSFEIRFEIWCKHSDSQ
jgi:hypothetical protein